MFSTKNGHRNEKANVCDLIDSSLGGVRFSMLNEFLVNIVAYIMHAMNYRQWLCCYDVDLHRTRRNSRNHIIYVCYFLILLSLTVE